MSVYKKMMGGITAPKGFQAAGVACGLKKMIQKDLALVFSERPATAAGVFTSNCVKGAPVIVSQRQIRHRRAQAIVINSGNANACTGEKGIEDAYRMVEVAAQELFLSPKYVLVASTGKIGVLLPIEKILAGIKHAAKHLSVKGGRDAAQAILTTDTKVKEIAIEFPLGHGEKAVLGGMVKGAGMINPLMATMIAVITTDAKIEYHLLQKALKRAVSKSFNMITVDDDRSTNDTVFLMANGLGDNKLITDGSLRFRNFQKALDYVCQALALKIVRDGEGATRLMEVCVTGAKNMLQAIRVAKRVAGSPLVKTALFGKDPNWGRMMAAIGSTRTVIDPDKISIFVGREQLVKDGIGIEYHEGRIKKLLNASEVVFSIDLGLGQESATAWGCDLGYGYIKINAKY